MTYIINQENVGFSKLSREQQIQWLSNIMFLITMFARETYEIESESVNNPVKLRKYNELVHRVSAQQLKIIQRDDQRMSDDIFLEFLNHTFCELNLDTKYIVENISLAKL